MEDPDHGCLEGARGGLADVAFQTVAVQALVSGLDVPAPSERERELYWLGEIYIYINLDILLNTVRLRINLLLTIL